MAGDLLPYLKFYPAETLADERFAAWNCEERGAWMTLCFHAWVNGSVPSDLPSLARICRMNPRTMDRVWRAIGDRFVPHSPGRLTSRRLEEERNDARTRSEGGRNGARARWEKSRNAPESQEPTDATASDAAMPAEQHNAEQKQHNTAQPIARAARVGVGHPAFEAVEHWTKTVWPTTSSVPCPPVETHQAQSLAALCGKNTTPVVLAAMDRAAADPFWADKLDLDTFIAKFPRFLHDAPAPQPYTNRVDERQEAARRWLAEVNGK